MFKKTILFLFCAFFAHEITAQTAAVAHKSHSGKAATMPAVREGGFGIPSDELEKIIKIDEQTVVEVRSWGRPDTTRNHPEFCNPKISLDSLRKRYPYLQFQGFERFEKPKTPAKSETKKRQKKARFWGAMDYPLPSERMALGVLGILSICAAAAFVQYKNTENVA